MGCGQNTKVVENKENRRKKGGWCQKNLRLFIRNGDFNVAKLVFLRINQKKIQKSWNRAYSWDGAVVSRPVNVNGKEPRR